MAATKRYLTVLGILVLLCAALGSTWYWTKRAGEPRLHKTLAWEGCYRLLLRSPAEEPGVLLLRALTTEESLARDRGLTAASQPGQSLVIYRYAPPAPKLKEVDRAAWGAAGGPVCDCDVVGVDSVAPFHFDFQKNTLRYRDQAVATAGKTVLDVTVSPSKRYVAVLSAAGKRRGSLMPFLGGGHASGQHYHEVYRRADGKRLGKPVPLPLPSGRTTLSHCWSPDEHYVVYTDVGLFELCIVHTELTKEGEQ